MRKVMVMKGDANITNEVNYEGFFHAWGSKMRDKAGHDLMAIVESLEGIVQMERPEIIKFYNPYVQSIEKELSLDRMREFLQDKNIIAISKEIDVCYPTLLRMRSGKKSNFTTRVISAVRGYMLKNEA